MGAQFVARNRAQKMGLFPCVFFGPECQRMRARYSALNSSMGSRRNAQEAPSGHRRPCAPRCSRKLREAPGGPNRPQAFSIMFPGAPRTPPGAPCKLPESPSCHTTGPGSSGGATRFDEAQDTLEGSGGFTSPGGCIKVIPRAIQVPVGARAQPCPTEEGFSRSRGALDSIGAQPQQGRGAAPRHPRRPRMFSGMLWESLRTGSRRAQLMSMLFGVVLRACRWAKRGGTMTVYAEVPTWHPIAVYDNCTG